MSPVSEEGRPVLLSTEEAPVHFTDVRHHIRCHPERLAAESPAFRITSSGLQNSKQYAEDGIYRTFILILNMSQDLITKLVIYIFQRYLNIKLLKMQIQIASYK